MKRLNGFGSTRSEARKALLSPSEVLHVSSAPSPTQFAAIQRAVRNSGGDVSYGMPESSFVFHHMLREGLVENSGTRVHSLVGRAIHPDTHHGRFWPHRTEKAGPHLVIEEVSVLNSRYFKQLWVGTAFLVATLRWRVRTRKSADKILIVDAAYVSALPWVLLALTGSRTKKLGLFADIYSYMGDATDARGSATIKHVLIRHLVRRLYARFNGFVLLTKAMNTVVNPLGRPSMVMEGMVSSSTARSAKQAMPAKTEVKTVMYAGALRQEYGLDDLLNGFRALRRDDVSLVIYGAGPFSSEIQSAAREDKRVIFGDRITVDAVAHEQKRAWVLANTRRLDDEFTKYSFPSKMLSYMSSGTPVLTTKLSGMPAEYLEHVYLVDGDGASAVTAALEKVLALDSDELNSFGRSAMRFVNESKNNRNQAGRILTFAREL